MGEEKKQEERKKLEAELERSLAVVKVKEAHKQIEETEKLRKRPIVQSICNRMTSFIETSKPTFDVLTNPKFKKLRMTENIVSFFENFKKTYLSIRYDFQKNLDIGEEGMTKMFPVIEVRTDNLDHATNDFLQVSKQMLQMSIYCQRFF